jgi:hypothetical protein
MGTGDFSLCRIRWRLASKGSASVGAPFGAGPLVFLVCLSRPGFSLAPFWSWENGADIERRSADKEH